MGSAKYPCMYLSMHNGVAEFYRHEYRMTTDSHMVKPQVYYADHPKLALIKSTLPQTQVSHTGHICQRINILGMLKRQGFYFVISFIGPTG